MKKYGIMLLALLACGAVNATQDATLTQRQVRDPRQLETILEANATDAESRLADIEAGTGIDELTANNATVRTNLTMSALTVSKPVFTDGSKILTSSGTMPVDQGGSGGTTFTDHGLLVGAAASVFEALAVGTDGQTIIGASTANPTWQTITGLFSYNASGLASGTAGYVLPAYSAEALTNIAGGNIASGDIAIDRIAEALKAPGAIGGTTPAAGAFTTVGATARITGEVTATTDETAIANYINATVSGAHGVGANLSYALGTYSSITAADYLGTNVYMAGVCGRYAVTGVNSSVYPKAAVLGWIDAASSNADGAFVALIDGDTDATTAGAAFTVRSCNSTPTSGFEYGLDLYTDAILSYNVVDILTADIRLHEGATIHNSGTDTLTITEVNVAVDGALTATSYEGVVAATLVAGAAAGATAVQPADVWGAPTATPSPTLLVNAVTIQAKTAAGGDLSEFRLIRVWTSETSMGAASTNNIETLVLSTGTAVDTVVAHADYRYVTATDGSALATITGTATGTNYVMVSDGSSISATAITFIP